MVKLRGFAGLTENGIHEISRKIIWISMISIFVMMILTFVDVTGRYVFNHPIMGGTEVTEQLMIMVVFLPAGYVTLRRGHIVVDLVISKLSRRIQVTLNFVSTLICAVISALIGWQAASWGWSLFINGGEHTLILHIAIFPFLLALSLGCFVMCLEFFIDSIKYATEMTSGEKASVTTDNLALD